MSATAMRPNYLPELIGQAFSIFASQRPRPVHIAIPIDVLAMPVTEAWEPRAMPRRGQPDPEGISASVALLAAAERPLAGPRVRYFNDKIKEITKHVKI